jgi:thiosulfate/3-mercaptopyruvate sulfurtransferase
MQKIIRDLGLNINDKVVIYDDGTFFDAARLFWTLEVYSFTDLKLLNAGFNSWKPDGYEISTTSPTVNQSNYIAQIDNKRLATKFTTQLATKNPNQIIIDARNTEAYLGKESSAKRYGHIPKAVNIPATHNINYDGDVGKLKNITNLRDTYKSIKKNQKVVLYCAIGKISATNYFAMRELGYNVSNYDASWNEWGNDFNLPIVNQSKE